MARKKANLITDYNVIKDMTREEKTQLAKQLAKRANVRLSTLEKHDLDNDTWAYGKASRYLRNQDRIRFYEGKKYNSERELNRQLQELTYFLNAKSSTIRGIKQMEKERYATFAKNHELDKSHMEDYYTFLQSEQFGLLRRTLDSETLFDDLSLALQQGVDLETLEKQYAEYTNTNITFEKVQEKYNRAEWQLAQTNGGKLLK